MNLIQRKTLFLTKKNQILTNSLSLWMTLLKSKTNLQLVKSSSSSKGMNKTKFIQKDNNIKKGKSKNNIYNMNKFHFTLKRKNMQKKWHLRVLLLIKKPLNYNRNPQNYQFTNKSPNKEKNNHRLLAKGPVPQRSYQIVN